MPLVAGVDCSTQATKVVVVDSDSGAVVAEGRSPHEVTGTGGTRETEPEAWWEALRDAIGQTERGRDIRALSIAGQQHGLVVADAAGRPLRPASLWNDTRPAPDAAQLVTSFGGPDVWAEEIGVVPVASFTAAKWAWLRRTQPDVAAATHAVRLPHDWITERLCGQAVTDRGDASGTAWWSTKTERYSPQVLELIELDQDLLPPVATPTASAGTVTGAAAAALGLAADTIVGPGTGDNMAAALGLGLAQGTPVISLGTSGTAYTRSGDRIADATGMIAGFADATGAFLPLAATLNCTQATDRFATWLGLGRDDIAERTDVTVLPYLDGERTPNLPDASGSVTGLRHDTTGPKILLAAYEGAAFSLLQALEAIAAAGAPINSEAPLVLIGGGAGGAAWQRVVGRLSGRRLVVPKATELVALGAAVQAAVILEGADSDEVAAAWRTSAGELLPAVTRDEARLATLSASVAAAGG